MRAFGATPPIHREPGPVSSAVLEDVDITLRILSLACNQRGDMRPVAVVVVRVPGPSVDREVEEPVGASAREVSALFEPGIDDGDAHLVTVVRGA